MLQSCAAEQLAPYGPITLMHTDAQQLRVTAESTELSPAAHRLFILILSTGCRFVTVDDRKRTSERALQSLALSHVRIKGGVRPCARPRLLSRAAC